MYVAPTIEVCMCTCNAGTVSVLRAPLGVSECRLMWSVTAVYLNSSVHIYICVWVWSMFTVQCALMIQQWCIYGDSTHVRT